MDNQTRQYLIDRHIDVDDFARRFCLMPDPEALLLTSLRLFPEDAKCYGQFVEALQQGDMEAAQKASHSLKGLAGNVSMTALFRASMAVNDELKRGVWPDSELVSTMEKEFNIAWDAVAGLEHLT